MELNQVVFPREKASKNGIDKLSDIELLALLLNTGTRYENVLEMSGRLLNEKGSLMNMLSDDRMDNGHGIGLAKAYRIRAVSEIIRRLPHFLPTRINNEREFFLIFRWCFFGICKEQMLIVTLDLGNMVKETRVIVGNSNNELEIDSRELYEYLKTCEGKRVVFAHNHPSGSVEASPIDMLSTERLRRLVEKAEKIFEGSYIFSRDKFKRIKKDKKIVDMLMG